MEALVRLRFMLSKNTNLQYFLVQAPCSRPIFTPQNWTVFSPKNFPLEIIAGPHPSGWLARVPHIFRRPPPILNSYWRRLVRSARFGTWTHVTRSLSGASKNRFYPWPEMFTSCFLRGTRFPLAKVLPRSSGTWFASGDTLSTGFLSKETGELTERARSGFKALNTYGKMNEKQRTWMKLG